MLPTALEEINRSDLPASTCRNALQLLALAHADNGHVMIAWQDLAAMWDISVGRSRKHLGTMQAANLLHYSSNGDGIVYVNFKAWTRVGARKMTMPRRSATRKRAWARGKRPLNGRKTRVGARKTATTSHVRARLI